MRDIKLEYTRLECGPNFNKLCMLDEYKELHPNFIPNEIISTLETRKCFLIPFIDDSGRD